MTLRFSVPGEPVGKARARFSTRGGAIRAYTPQKTRDYEQLVAWAARAAGATPMAGPVKLTVTAYFKTPTKGKNGLPVIKRPDGDNILKAVSDALNGVAYRDDAQVYDGRIVKLYSDSPRVEVLLEFGE